jgi:hypothetical protein
MIEVIFKIFLTDYIDFQGFITKRVQKPLLIEYSSSKIIPRLFCCSVTCAAPTGKKNG